jgi:histidinol dehydrogenase
MESLIGTLSRPDIVTASLAKHGASILVNSLKQGVEIANRIAPEHLQLMVEQPEALLSDIRHAGAIFGG